MNKLLPARPTTYKGTAMRSRLEAAYAEQFDAFGWQWQYEPQCFGTEDGQYLPDFRLQLNSDEPAYTYVEVKPSINEDQNIEEVDSASRSWKIIKASDPDATAFILCFGSDDAGRILWGGLIDGWSRPRSVCPVIVGTARPHVVVMRDPRLNSFSSPPTRIPTPVASLYATHFAHDAGINDEFDLRSQGC